MKSCTNYLLSGSQHILKESLIVSHSKGEGERGGERGREGRRGEEGRRER